MLIDVHAHLDLIKDLDDVIKRAEDANIKLIISAGIDPKTNKEVLRLAEKYSIIKPALGIYPLDALEKENNKEYSFDVDEEIEFIRSQKDKIIAVSEFGLDYLSENADKERQKEIFLKLLKLAKEIDKPVIVHTRKAETEVIEILKREQMKKVVLHCFCGKKSLIKKAAELGYYFSIPPIIVNSQQFQNLVKEVNLKQILTETDSPYLSPYPGKINEPAFISETIEKIAEIKELSIQEVEEQIFKNAKKLFSF